MFNIAAGYERLGQFSSALKWFEQAVKVKPDFEIAHAGASLNLFKLGRYKEAAKHIRACIAIYTAARTKAMAQTKSKKTTSTLPV